MINYNWVLCLCFLAGFTHFDGVANLKTDELIQSDKLRVLTWEGYVTDTDILNVNTLLKQAGYHYQVEVISPYAQGAQQMFDLIRAKQCDITFLTLFFIKMQQEQTAKLLQPINTHSPRLTNYLALYPSLTKLSMGVDNQGSPLYIPWGGGIYGFYIDRDRVDAEQIPNTVSELWNKQWRGKFSLNHSQEWYNLGLVLMRLGKSPFFIYNALRAQERQSVLNMSDENGIVQQSLSELYLAAGDFWKSAPSFHQELLIVSSWGPEIYAQNTQGSNWQLIDFKEGHMAWLDTINFVKGLSGKKLEAAEIFANYFISKEVQTRVSKELSMVPASSLAPINKLLGGAEQIFKQDMFVPPYDYSSYELMKRMTDRANRQAGNTVD